MSKRPFPCKYLIKSDLRTAWAVNRLKWAVRHDLSLKHQQNCARKDTRSFARAENRIKLNTQTRPVFLPRVVLRIIRTSRGDLTRVRFHSSKPNQLQTHAYTHTRALQPQTGSVSVTRGICARLPPLSGEGVAESVSQPIRRRYAPTYQRKPRPLLVGRVWQEPREYIQFFSKLFKPYKVYICATFWINTTESPFEIGNECLKLKLSAVIQNTEIKSSFSLWHKHILSCVTVVWLIINGNVINPHKISN